MALADYAAYTAKLLNPRTRLAFTKLSITTIAGRMSDLCVAGGMPPSITTPTNWATVDRTLNGALGQLNGDSTPLRMPQIESSCQAGGTLLVYDRLAHCGGFDATSTANQPGIDGALTPVREYSGGIGHMLAAEIYTQIGVTGTTITAAYTNSDSTTGRTTQATDIGAAGFREVGRVIILPLQAGDVGVDSGQHCNLLATTGTAGNFGMTLFKPLFMLPVLPGSNYNFVADAIRGGGLNFPEILDGACLCFAMFCNTTSSGVFNGNITLFEE